MLFTSNYDWRQVLMVGLVAHIKAIGVPNFYVRSGFVLGGCLMISHDLRIFVVGVYLEKLRDTCHRKGRRQAIENEMTETRESTR